MKIKILAMVRIADIPNPRVAVQSGFIVHEAVDALVGEVELDLPELAALRDGADFIKVNFGEMGPRRIAREKATLMVMMVPLD